MLDSLRCWLRGHEQARTELEDDEYLVTFCPRCRKLWRIRNKDAWGF